MTVARPAPTRVDPRRAGRRATPRIAGQCAGPRRGTGDDQRPACRGAESGRAAPGRRSSGWRAARDRLRRRVADIRIEGEEHVPEAGPVLIAANHVSMWDAPVLLCYSRDDGR